MNSLWSNLVQNLDPYVAGEQPKDKTYIKLNTNENPYPPSPKVMQAIQSVTASDLRLYPDPDASSLRTAIAEYYAVSPTNIFVGNGSDEVLGFAFVAFFKKENPLYFPEITYSFYPSYCRLYEIRYRQCAMANDWSIQFDDIGDSPGGIVFPNPNAPTGMLLSLQQIESLVKRYQDIVIVVDEAYIDFGGDTAIELTQTYSNLLVVQTCSKSRSLAGLRVGYAVGHPNLIAALERVKNSFNAYPLDAIAIRAATASFEDQVYFEQCCNQIIETRDWFTAQLNALSFQVLESKSNFVFARHTQVEAKHLSKSLKEKAILVRHFSSPKIDNYLRISIGTREDMEGLIDSLGSILVA
ncbi:histidinol-phosphate transaminase [Ketobacter sp. MCCC 1A13808]|uniref:histidinol-phosphate transaminase n=1 Tax=Ketobacter sp. MCCC 1A13808 TaxID=2602738 RepID=UPI000F1503A3|nr:histidinol-phosphate transaminase [Ketobacter sp. MCCC 1A13808]MVF14198.1 histidinol-phosphate transaminase [Ketobacter sp. MCCC 1A13808]RLP54105.1 MAG: histidinol-phosphate transaminase [Ketobacter sp.]